MTRVVKKIMCIFVIALTLSIFGTVVANAQEYFLIGGKLEGGIYQRTYNYTITNTTVLTAVKAPIADWNWHLNPDNNGQGVDFYFFETYPSRAATLHFEEIAAGTDYALAYTRMYDSSGNHLTASYLRTHPTVNWTSVVIYINTDSPYYTDAAVMQKAMNHEIGHALGLDENPTDNGTIMYNGFYDFGYWYQDRWWPAWTATVPTAADLAGVRYLYG